MDIGHFFLAIDPTAFRPAGEFEATVDELIDALHATKPVDPKQPVLVAGEPENMMRAEREKIGCDRVHHAASLITVAGSRNRFAFRTARQNK